MSHGQPGSDSYGQPGPERCPAGCRLQGHATGAHMCRPQSGPVVAHIRAAQPQPEAPEPLHTVLIHDEYRQQRVRAPASDSCPHRQACTRNARWILPDPTLSLHLIQRCFSQAHACP